MLDPRYVDYIISRRKKGFDDKEINNQLLDFGFKKENIKEAFDCTKANPNISFHQGVNKYGPLFSILFYFYTIFFVVGMISILSLIINSKQFLLLVPGIVLSLIFISFVKKKEYYKIAIITTISSPLPVIILGIMPLIQSFSNISNSVIYLFYFIYAGLNGFFLAYIFNELSIDSKKYVIAGSLFSFFLVAMFALNKLLINLFHIIRRQMWLIFKENPSVSDYNFFNFDFFNATTGLIISILIFNIIFLYFFFNRSDLKKGTLKLYIFPVVGYFILSLVIWGSSILIAEYFF